MFYKCEDCGHIFEDGEQSKWVEPHGEKLSGCPVCFGNYEEAKHCEICGKISCLKSEKLCDECKKETIKEFQAMMLQFTDAQREYLDEEGFIIE